MIILDGELIPLIRDAFERGQRVRLTGTGHSMRPFINNGDVVELVSIHSLPRLGDIVQVQRSGKKCILHRVVRLDGRTFLLRGDAQAHYEGPFTRRDLLGRVVRTYRNGRARELDRDIWRLAGLIWNRCKPLGLWLFLLAGCMRRSGGKVKQSLTEWGARFRLN